MKWFGKTLLFAICFNFALTPLMAENAFSYKDTEQINSETSKQPKKRKRVKQPNNPKGTRTPHVQSKCKYISEQDEIHQVGLNISQFMDIENFKGMPRYFGGNKKADNKRDITIKAVQYFEDLGLSDPKEIHNASKKYFQDLAQKAYDNGKYQLAYHYFTTAIEGEKYSNKELDECKKNIAEKKNNFKHGDIFFFGKYEQDGNLKNGPEPIEWIVLRDTGEELILLSRYVLAHKAFDTTEEMFIWEDSTLCSWLNKEFYNGAFNEEEKRRMRKIGSDWYAEDYAGDYVVIPVLNDYSDLIDNFWLRAYAVPSDEEAQDLIDYEGKPFILSKDRNGNAKWYEYNIHLENHQPNVLTSNEKVDKFSNLVYWPSGYWINQHNGITYLPNDKCVLTYTFCDENGFFHNTKAKYINGVRPVISVAYANLEKTSMLQKPSVSTNNEFSSSELDGIHQVGLNIFKFMDFATFDNSRYFSKSDKKVVEKRNTIKKAVKYFTDKGMTDPVEIYSFSKKYFQDLAEKKYQSGEYELAYKYFSTILEGEKYDQPKLLDCKKHIAENKSKFKTGDIVFFGKYEQDGNFDNGPEPIEWIVLKNSDNKIILLSKYVLAHRAVHSVGEQFKWFESELCSWLNEEFYSEAFNEAEKKRMFKVGNNIWYMKEYEGDYVVIPGTADLEELDNYWVKTCAVPSDNTAMDMITFNWKPYTISKDDNGNIYYDSDSGFDFYGNSRSMHKSVLTMNPDINKDSNLVYLPSGYWINHNNGGGSNCVFYCFTDENGILWGGSDARNCNGIRPLIGITCSDGED